MAWIDGVLKLFDQYPNWAKAFLLTSIALMGVILVFARKAPEPAPVQLINSKINFRITGIQLNPQNSNVQVKVITTINDIEHKFPDMPDVDWMRIGPDMTPKTISLPATETLHIQFRMEHSNGLIAKSEEIETIDVKKSANSFPISKTYNLHNVVNGAAQSGISAVIFYRIGE